MGGAFCSRGRSCVAKFPLVFVLFISAGAGFVAIKFLRLFVECFVGGSFSQAESP